MGSEQVAQVLRKVGQHVKLVIARLVADESNVDGGLSEVEVRATVRIAAVTFFVSGYFWTSVCF